MKIVRLLVGLLIVVNVKTEDGIKCPDGHVNVGGKCLVEQPIKGGSQQKVEINKCKDGEVLTSQGCQSVIFNTPIPLKNQQNVIKNAQVPGPIPSLNVLQNSLIQQLSQFTNNLSSEQQKAQKVQNISLLRQEPVVLIKHQKSQQQATNTTTPLPTIVQNPPSLSPTIINITSLPLPIPAIHQNNTLFPFNQTNIEQPQILNVSINQIDNTTTETHIQPQVIIHPTSKQNCKGGAWIQSLNICIPQHCPPNYQYDANTQSCIQPQPTCQHNYIWNGRFCIPKFISQNIYAKLNNTQQILKNLDCFNSNCIFNICPPGFTQIDSNCYPTSAQSICPQQNINSKGYCVSHYKLKIQLQPTCIQGQSFWNGNYCQKIGY